MLQDLGAGHGNNLGDIKLIYCCVSTAGSQSVCLVQHCQTTEGKKNVVIEKGVSQSVFCLESLYSSSVTDKLKMLLIFSQM